MSVSIDDMLNIGHIHAQNMESLKGSSGAGVSTDSRTLRAGEIFFALRGESFDGHEFIDAAFARGASCAVVDRRASIGAFGKYALLVVDDTTKALGTLANIYRKKFRIPFIAVAGSNGKTTTKEMISTVLKTQYNVLSTEGNLNNHIGVPQTLLRLDQHHRVAVVEIGTNHFGELQYLCDIIEPTHGIITNIGHEHMKFFHNLDGVAQAEGELFTALATSGVGYVNTDDQYLVEQGEKLNNKLTYGFSEPSVDVRGTILSIDAQGRASFSVSTKQKGQFEVQLSVPGKHMVLNGLAAATVGLSHGIETKNIRVALREFTAVSKRMQVITLGGATIINDSYNANPDSVLSALETLASMKCSGKKIVVLGDMLELGSASDDEHRNIGRAVKRFGFEFLLTFGPYATGISEAAQVRHNSHFEQKEQLSEKLLSVLKPGDIVLIKGSRGMKMEEIVARLQKEFGK
jgi:UDP-N-acetylmuramoyl-tripeptide--D-alanyl-D-alanine ligase